jgi:hypothetical protein
VKHLLSIHVYDSTTPSEFDALIELLAGMKSRHAATDPAPGHPELPLPASLTGLVNQPAKKFHFLDETDTRLPKIAAADPLKVAMDDPVESEDPTRREFPWGDLPEPPPLPEGKTRWVNRGEFLKYDISANGRKVAFLDAEGTWRETFNFSTILPHIEAI